jgi:hypothetical protein
VLVVVVAAALELDGCRVLVVIVVVVVVVVVVSNNGRRVSGCRARVAGVLLLADSTPRGDMVTNKTNTRATRKSKLR